LDLPLPSFFLIPHPHSWNSFNRSHFSIVMLKNSYNSKRTQQSYFKNGQKKLTVISPDFKSAHKKILTSSFFRERKIKTPKIY
jgi:hypothetical protein